MTTMLLDRPVVDRPVSDLSTHNDAAAQRRLRAARAEVDCIDDSILALIEMRLRLADRVAAAKGDGPKRRPEREAEVLGRLSAAREVAPEGLVRAVWSALMAESLARQGG